jgi:hypothetical protein
MILKIVLKVIGLAKGVPQKPELPAFIEQEAQTSSNPNKLKGDLKVK